MANRCPEDETIEAPLTPLQVYQSRIGDDSKLSGMGRTMGMTLVEAEHGRIVYSGCPDERHYNPMGFVHGGYFGTLLDSAMGCAVHSALKVGMSYTTLEYKVTLMRPMTRDTGRVLTEGRVINVGRTIGYAEGSITDGSGKIYAHGTTTCLIFPEKRELSN